MKGIQEKRHYPNPTGRLLSVFRNDSPTQGQPRVLRHWHDYLELLVLEEGSCELDLEQQKINLQTGDLLLIGSCTSHSIDNMAGCRFWVMQFATDWLNDLSGPELTDLLPFMQPDSHCLAHVSIVGHPEIHNLLLDIELDYHDQPPAMELSVRGSLLKLIAWLIRQQQITYPAGKQEKTWLAQLQPALVYVRRHYAEKVSEKTVASLCYLSQPHFSRIFHQITGQRFVRFLHFIRLQEARRELATTSRPISQIALDVGFSSASHFTAIFRQETGLTPQAYRKQNSDRT